MIAYKDLHDGCKVCRQTSVVENDIVDSETNTVIARKGDFIINCEGIPKDPVEDLIKIGERAKKPFTRDDAEALASVRDPVLWAYHNISVLDPEYHQRGPWIPQGATEDNIAKYGLDPTSAYYQELMVKCTATRNVLRLGRRSGKSWSLCAKILHKMFTLEKYRVMIIAPGIPQLDVIFDQINEFIESSDTLKQSKETFKKTPQRYLELTNGSKATGFVAGGDAMRGQAADMIIIDECAYIGTDDLSAITAILTEHAHTILIAASTPTGAREQFWRWDIDPEFKTFHYPSMCRPRWTARMEYEQKKENPGTKYDHEILAIHGTMAEGVFQQIYVDRALTRGDYTYEEQSPQDGKIYMMGVDWNPVNGTEAIVVEGDMSDPSRPTYKTVDAGRVFREGNTQLQALQEIIRLNRKWEPMMIYVDRGAGAGQIEILNQFGADAEAGTADKRLEEIVKPIDFGSKIELYHPVEGTKFKDYAKPAVVENVIRCLEADQVIISSFDEDLIKALRGYIVEKISSNGRQVYAMVNKNIPDHRLDAWMLAMFAFMMELTKMGKPEIVTAVGVTGHFGEKTVDVTPFMSVADRSNVQPLNRTEKLSQKPEKKQDPRIEVERELNFIPATVIVESSKKDGIQTRVTHNIAPPTRTSSRAPVSRSKWRT